MICLCVVVVAGVCVCESVIESMCVSECRVCGIFVRELSRAAHPQ